MNRHKIIFALVGLLVALTAVELQAQNRLVYNRVFAPQEGLLGPTEKPYRDELVLNGLWQFQPVALPADFKRDSGNAPTLSPPIADRWDKKPIRIPSPWNVNAFPYGPGKSDGPGGDFRAFPSYPLEWERAEMGWLRRTVTVPANWNGKRIVLHFEAVAGATEVYVNGKLVGTNFELFLPFEIDVTDTIKFNAENEILVGVRKAELFSKAGPVGKREFVAGSMWGESIVGIWQDVYLDARPTVHVSDSFIKPLVDSDALEVDALVTNESSQPQTVDVSGVVQPWINEASTDPATAAEPKSSLGEVALSLPRQSLSLAAGETKTLTLKANVGGKLKRWSPDAPNLYGVTVSLDIGGTAVDRKFVRFGYRQFKLTSTKLQLNGVDIDLKGDAWHFVGVPQMTRRYACAWYQAIKDANGNCVRLHAQPYPRFYLDVADEVGMLVLDETAIWGSGGTPKFDSRQYWNNADAHLHALVQRDRNHPSVMGYSLTNEILMVMRNKRTPKEYTDMAFDYYRKWLKDLVVLDPTRPWISGDGEEDANGILPVLIGHYGGLDAPKHWAAKGKPWGIGESGMAYYGTPKQVSEYNGDAAYEDMQQRMEGVAIQAYELITRSQRPLNPAYASIFNIAWYSLKPLPLGLGDTSRAPQIDDGVWFGPFIDGQPGMQPERLGPYCTTLNPGYNPNLPAYEKWPLFDAIKAGFAPGAPAPSVYSQRRKSLPAPAISPPKSFKSVALLSAGKSLAIDLQLLGVPLSQDNDQSELLVIDGSAPPDSSTKGAVDRALNAGGTVIVWQPKADKLTTINSLLPEPFNLTNRQAVSLVIPQPTQLASGLSAADFYFAELKPDVVLPAGLSGPLVDHGQIILQACNADWRVWNNQPEVVKTGAIMRSELQAKPGGAAMVQTPVGKGRIILVNLAGLTVTAQRVEVARKLLANIGLELNPPRELISGGVFSNSGALREALILGRFDGKAPEDLTAANTSELDQESVKSPRKDMTVSNAKWIDATADPSTLVFDLTHCNLPGSNNNAVAYVSVWINSPRSLDDVLAEPDVPHVDLLINGSERASAMWLNGSLVKDDGALASKSGVRQAFPALVLKRGWNHLLIKLYRYNGDWKFSAQLQCTDTPFLSGLEAVTERPQQ